MNELIVRVTEIFERMSNRINRCVVFVYENKESYAQEWLSKFEMKIEIDL